MVLTGVSRKLVRIDLFEHEEDEKYGAAPRSVRGGVERLPKDWDEYCSQRGFEDETSQFKRFLSKV